MLYNELDPGYREQFRGKLLDQARKMYYYGHQRPAGGPNANYYWQQDPQNNHRWHRNAGLALAVLAVADPDRSDDDWILLKTKQELDFIHEWLPPDGSNHEGPGYAAFGSYNNYTFLATAANGLADPQAGLLRLHEERPGAFEFGWMSVVWHDPELDGGSIDDLPRKLWFDDIGLASMRDGWEADNVALSFKSGIYGGRKLNEYRNGKNYHYINIAHDDPDANSFLIHARGQMLVQPDGYATTTKLTAAHNTILVNGIGQKGEGSAWTQPLGGADADMTGLARITCFDDQGDVTIVEGEAGAAYRASLTRYRRTIVFSEGRYILVLDDIRAAESRDITWLVQSGQVDVVDAANGRFALAAGGVGMPFILKANLDYSALVATSVAQHNGNSLNLEQLQAGATTDQWRSAALFDAWGLGDLDLDFVAIDPLVTELHISGPGFTEIRPWDSTGEFTSCRGEVFRNGFELP